MDKHKETLTNDIRAVLAERRTKEAWNEAFIDDMLISLNKQVSVVFRYDGLVQIHFMPGVDVGPACRLAYHIMMVMKYDKLSFLFNGYVFEISDS